MPHKPQIYQKTPKISRTPPSCSRRKSWKIIGRSLGIQEEFLRDDVRRGRSLRDKCQLKVMDDPVHHGIIHNKSDDLHLSSALITNQRVYFVHFSYHLCPAPVRDSRTLLPNEDEGMLIGLCLAQLAPVGVGIGRSNAP
jgi:hypothetical protein